MAWDPTTYLANASLRERPGLELLARVSDLTPARIVDLGCGPGTLTLRVAEAVPDATVVGVDSSPEMLDRAREEDTAGRVRWVEADAATWRPDAPVDLLFSNAALHWLDDHATLFGDLFGHVAEGGALAVQMPRNHAAPTHRAIVETAADGPWATRLEPILREWPVHEPAFYVDVLEGAGATVDVWETIYQQRLTGDDPVVTWTSGSVLRPVLDVLGRYERETFLAGYRARVDAAYPRRPDGSVLVPFRRLFLVARR